MNATIETARAPHAQDAKEIRELVDSVVQAMAAGEVSLDAGILARRVEAYLAGEAERLPARVGSPAMRVVAAIPVGSEGREVIAVVEQSGWDNPMHWGTIRGYRSDMDDGTVRWYAEAGHYDYTDLRKAIRGMCNRAGIKVVWPDPAELTRDMILAQRLAEQMYAVATSDNHEIARYDSGTYRHMELAFVAAVEVAYGVSRKMAQRVSSLLAEYGPDNSLRGTRGRGVFSYVQFARTHSAADYGYLR